MVTRAFLVGLEKYANPRNNLIGVGNDVSAFVRVLARYGISDIQVIRDQNANKAGIIQGLTSLLEQTRAGDVAIFYYSGHGALVSADFSGSDDPDGQDEALVPYECDTANLILDNQIRDLLRAKLHKEAFFYGVYDCCYSGDIQKNVELGFNLNAIAYPGYVEADVDKVVRMEDLIYNGFQPIYINRAIGFKQLVLDAGAENAAHFGASEPDKTALVVNIDGMRRSVFTWALEEVLRPGVDITTFENAVKARQATKTSHHTPYVTCSPTQRKRMVFR